MYLYFHIYIHVIKLDIYCINMYHAALSMYIYINVWLHAYVCIHIYIYLFICTYIYIYRYLYQKLDISCKYVCVFSVLSSSSVNSYTDT